MQGERIADLMATQLPDVSVAKHPIHPDEWDSYFEGLCARLGCVRARVWVAVADVRCRLQQSRSGLNCVVWTDTGRLIGNQDDLEQLALREYGIKLDLDAEQLRQTARQNFRTALTQQKSKMVCGGALRSDSGGCGETWTPHIRSSPHRHRQSELRSVRSSLWTYR